MNPFTAFLRRLAVPVLLILLVALGTWAAFNSVKTTKKISNLETSVRESEKRAAKAEADLIEGRLKGSKELLQAQGENRKLEREWQAKFDKANQENADEKRVTQTALDRTSAERDRLRNETRIRTAYPQYAGGTACDPEDLRRVAATAATTGELLLASDGVSEALGRQAEDLASQVRGLQASLAALEN